jgi:hypothetical protein
MPTIRVKREEKRAVEKEWASSCEKIGFLKDRAIIWHSNANNLVWLDMEMTGLESGARPHHRNGDDRHQQQSRNGRRIAGLGGAPVGRVLDTHG